LQFVGNSVKVNDETILSSDPAKQRGEFAFVPAGKIFPPVNELMIVDGKTFLVWNDLFSGFGRYVMEKNANVEAIPPLDLKITYNSLQPWVLDTDIDVVAPKEKKFSWVWLLLAGLFIYGRK
jgi:hypothetical protein